MRSFALAVVLLAAAGLSGCAKCSMPTWSMGGWFEPAACSEDSPRR